MVKKIGRYSHFILAVSSSLFVFLATVTGIILAFEPIQSHFSSQSIDWEEQTIADLLPQLLEKCDELLEISIEDNRWIKVDAISENKNYDGSFYISPQNAEIIEKTEEKQGFFKFITILHRSLFIHKTGRIIVGIHAFLLALLTLSGLILVLKKQNGWSNFFKSNPKEDFAPFYHTLLGKWFLLPIFVVCLSAVFLSLHRFDLLPQATESKTVFQTEKSENKKWADFKIFKETQLNQFKKLEIPFSTDEKDYLILSLEDKTLYINQKTGDVAEEISAPWTEKLRQFSFAVHTGQHLPLWAIALGLSGLGILFFMYSGTLISVKRLKGQFKNKYTAEQAEFIVLFGSENGSTRQYALQFYQSLLQQEKKVYLQRLNAYELFPQMTHLVIFTSTYGDGEAPANADGFIKKLGQIEQEKNFYFAVVALGSKSYRQFCKFGKELDEKLNKQHKSVKLIEVKLIDNQSVRALNHWAEKWKEKTRQVVEFKPLKRQKNKNHQLQLVQKQKINDEGEITFLLTFKLMKKVKFRSGDLLSILPPGASRARKYSIGKIGEDKILLSVKKHAQGLCSSYLYQRKEGEIIPSEIQQNTLFHCNPQASSLSFIANGTGIAPFLGMLNEGDNSKFLYWGGKRQQSYQLYQSRLENDKKQGKIEEIHLAFSRENKLEYVQKYVQKDSQKLVERLTNGGEIMICGSVEMAKEVLTILADALTKHSEHTIENYLATQQIKIDSY